MTTERYARIEALAGELDEILDAEQIDFLDLPPAIQKTEQGRTMASGIEYLSDACGLLADLLEVHQSEI